MPETLKEHKVPCCVIADDVRMIRQQFSHWMAELGFSVIHATCGVTALAAIRRSQPSLVITDIDMPDVSVMHLLHTIRGDADEQIANVPVIVCSSIQDAKLNRMVKQFGGSAFLKKPVIKERFLNSLQSILAGDDHGRDTCDEPSHHVSPRFRQIISGLLNDT